MQADRVEPTLDMQAFFERRTNEHIQSVTQ
jgi:hypothetical protein